MPALWRPHPCELHVIRHRRSATLVQNTPCKNSYRKHRTTSPQSSMRATERPRERDLRTQRRDCLVPDLEDAVPRPGGDRHAVLGHAQTTHSVVVTSQHTYQQTNTFHTHQTKYRQYSHTFKFFYSK